jgi:hypothetical protein
MVEPSTLLERVAVTLRREIAPQLVDEYARTQAHMAGLIAEKLAVEVRLRDEHARADRTARRALLADLEAWRARHHGEVPAELAAALDTTAAHGDAIEDREVCRVIELLYRSRGALSATAFDEALTRIRSTLRAQLDRRLERTR